MNKTNQLPLEPNKVYHLFSHAVHNNDLYYSPENYAFFLRRWQHFSKGYFETYAFCLMPNHFHFCLKTLPQPQLDASSKLASSSDVDKIYSKIINNFLSSYAQALNKHRQREGTLFRGRFKRLPIADREYFRDVICYIHHNPIHHFGVDNYSDWSFSSYNFFQHELKELSLKTDTVLSVFNQSGGFYEYHEAYRRQKRFWNIENRVREMLKDD